jgi:hypothetical protein
MKKVDTNSLSKIKGGTLIDSIAKICTSSFDFLLGLGQQIEIGVFGQQALNSHADSVSIDVKNGKVTEDNTKSNLAAAEYKMQQLKQFGAPAAAIVHMI